MTKKKKIVEVETVQDLAVSDEKLTKAKQKEIELFLSNFRDAKDTMVIMSDVVSKLEAQAVKLFKK